MIRFLFILFLIFSTPAHAWIPGSSLSVGRWPPIKGLVAFGSLGWNGAYPTTAPPNAMEEPLAHPGVYEGAVCNLRWLDLQPVQGGPIVTTSADACLANVTAYNALYPSTPMVAMFRVFAGQNAPAWAMNLNGGPITFVENGGFSAGLWWAPSYRAAWTDFQNKLAAIYNSNPLIHEVAITSCSVHSAEPFIEPVGTTDLALLLGAGYTDTAELACLVGWVTDYAAWTKPSLDYSVSNFNVTITGAAVPSSVYTNSTLVTHRLLYSTTGIIANHALQNPVPVANQPYYAYLTLLNAPVGFQYVSQAAQSGDATTCPSYGTPYNVSKLEMWDTTAAGGTATNTLAQLQACSKLLGGYSP